MQTDKIKSQSGFTLLELLVALFLFALLSSVLFTALRFGSMTLNRVTVYANGTNDLSISEWVLNQWLEEAYPQYIPPALDGTPGHVDFNGEPNSISFLSPSPLSIAPGGMVRMRLSIHGAGGAQILDLSAKPELAWPGKGNVTEETLVTGISVAGFEYWGADRKDGPNYWHSNWVNRSALPSLIRIIIKFPSGDFRKWPELLVAPMVYVDQACQFAFLTQSCLNR